MFIFTIVIYNQLLARLPEINWRSRSKSIMIAGLLVFTLPAWGQGGSDYLNAMDEASGNKDRVFSVTSSAADQEVLFAENEISIELESLLSMNYPEEFSLYRKFDIASKTEIVAAFESTAGKEENVRIMKVINKIGLMGDAGGWSY